ncbi:hypothetical protein [Leptospira interrogans]|uniref:Uncharacterized protein n=1 Tax=Leptospira interrogans serovar Lora str. TE 1992 TaxID=1193028 RepID=M3CQG0_LEPIR|nr:hypothetical protein [Leptospira interrogans]EMF43854.1 hypothetical protein LEP1GSC067_1847 [Leptospira interrogans serovar Lora str. TE 1992]AKH78608.1 hypothetical protein BRAT_17190 [Leptospira interrogans serovar Bratislava]EKR24795.1 hypothetical protein LEP1GSC087_1963 [Leptospira interrogans serovar Bataviae str. L1111]EMN09288.1 hypothetical protein LEP1GSC053_0824 [Leptospira interrogans serovar Muenchen str. Brem 129]KLO76031.1 Uncharacterized protein AAY48_3024 [Leptospira inter
MFHQADSKKNSILTLLKFQTFLFLFFFASYSTLKADDSTSLKKATLKDYTFQPYTQEGYFQAWNYSYRDDKIFIYATFLISNLGPGTKNCGISLVIHTLGEGTKFVTKEFSVKELSAEKGKFDLKIENNRMSLNSEGIEIQQDVENIKLFLSFKSDLKQGVSLSGGKHTVKDPSGFVQADMAFSFQSVWGYLIQDGKKKELLGTGGLEHLLTNYEVYKYSKRWELFRSINSKEFRFYTGGFLGNDSFPGGYFRTAALLNPEGKTILSGRIIKFEVLETAKEPFSGYDLPLKEKFYFEDDCSAEIIRKQSVGSIYVLSNISSVLRFFIRLFFAKPYQIYSLADLNVQCSNKNLSSDSLETFSGILSYYLINP